MRKEAGKEKRKNSEMPNLVPKAGSSRVQGR